MNTLYTDKNFIYMSFYSDVSFTYLLFLKLKKDLGRKAKSQALGQIQALSGKM